MCTPLPHQVLFKFPLDFTAIVFVLFGVVFVVMRACRNRFILRYHADVILYPVLTAHFYFLFWISVFLSLKVVSHQQVFR